MTPFLAVGVSIYLCMYVEVQHVSGQHCKGASTTEWEEGDEALFTEPYL